MDSQVSNSILRERFWLRLMVCIGVVFPWIGFAINKFLITNNPIIVSQMFFFLSMFTTLFLVAKTLIFFINSFQENKRLSLISSIYATTSLVSFIVAIILYVVF